MTSLHPGSTDPAPPGPSGTAADGADSSPPTDGPRPPGAGAPICSIATAADVGAPGAPGALVRHDSVPQPRTPEDVEARLRRAKADGAAANGAAANGATADGGGAAGGSADGGTDDCGAADGGTASDTTSGAATTARLREAFADRLRAARAEGRSLAELAAACRRPVAEVRALLGEAEEASEADSEVDSGPEADAGTGVHAGASAGSGAGSAYDRTGSGFVRFERTAAPVEGNRPAAVARSGREELRSLGSRRPSPSRRLRRMHPPAGPTGQEAAARETAATDPAGTRPPGAGWTGTPTGATGPVAGHPTTAPPEPGANAAYRAGTGLGVGTGVGTGVGVEGATAVGASLGTGTEAARAEPPLGILIGGSPVQSDAVGRPEERTPVRVTAEPIRVGRGTSLVVLPSWRPAIAVSVSTEQLIIETGLTVEQLAGARLTVRMNPWALHDRELDLHGWELGPAGPGGRAARRGGRGQAFGM
ncbi:hypothetical protein ACFC1T_04560 [Kitasatospora sp. NPDC056076]|uniref:hypothetical protein n=1 Tax=Kitasatospora sp. NPDC056076 TaxID=3345703 RepID=UPI0035E08C73